MIDACLFVFLSFLQDLANRWKGSPLQCSFSWAPGRFITTLGSTYKKSPPKKEKNIEVLLFLKTKLKMGGGRYPNPLSNPTSITQ